LSLCQSASITGTFVLPTTIAPADSRRSTAAAVRGLGASLSGGNPQVLGDPRYANDSLIVTGTPRKAPDGVPAASTLSACVAHTIARSRSCQTIALSAGLWRSIR
jgi:hypothetical protein